MNKLDQAHQALGLADYLAIVRRRLGPMAAVFLVAGTIAAVVALALPPVYRSTATILIQEQEIPSDFVRSTVTSFADERIQVISQQVMTSAVLLKLVEQHGLYAEDRKWETNEQIVERMRGDIRLEPVSVEITDRRTGTRSQATIAFKLSYESRDPRSAQRVANELVTLYLNENIKTRTQRAAEASLFLGEEADRLQKQLEQLDASLTALKQRAQGSLPEHSSLNFQLLDRTDQEMARIERDAAMLQERIVLLENQLAQTPPYGSLVGVGGERIQSPADRLKLLKSQYASLAGLYSEQHPDVIRVKREIEALEREGVTALPDAEDYSKEVAALESQLAAALDRYGEDHPDVQKLRRAIANVKSKAAGAAPADKRLSTRSDKPDNPVYLALANQIDSARAEVKLLQNQRAALDAKRRSFEARLSRIPEVERDYVDLLRERENTLVRYREIRAKLMQAEVAQELEKDRKAERFTLIEPPLQPERPFKPNRPAILFLGLVVSAAGSLGVTTVLEALDRTVKGARDLARRTAVPILGTIPRVEDHRTQQRKRRRKLLLWFIIAVALVALMLAVHFYVRPLDALWDRLLRLLRIE